MADALTTITNIVNSPPGQLAAGAALAGIVWKFFERVESLLPDSTKFEIAVWLVGMKTTETIQSWPETFLAAFHRLFGEKHPSWKGLRRSIVASCVMFLLVFFVDTSIDPRSIETVLPLSVRPHSVVLQIVLAIFFAVTGSATCAIGMAIPDYAALLTLRATLRWTLTHRNVRRFALFVSTVISLGYGLLSFVFFLFVAWLIFQTVRPEALRLLPASLSWYQPDMTFWAFMSREMKGASTSDWMEMILGVPPLLVGMLWLILYVFSGFLVRMAQDFDVGFQWFNRKFDIEKKPLQSIGLVAGALTALVYWGAAILVRII